jgi:hypothetical protein
MNHG